MIFLSKGLRGDRNPPAVNTNKNIIFKKKCCCGFPLVFFGSRTTGKLRENEKKTRGKLQENSRETRENPGRGKPQAPLAHYPRESRMRAIADPKRTGARHTSRYFLPTPPGRWGQDGGDKGTPRAAV